MKRFFLFITILLLLLITSPDVYCQNVGINITGTKPNTSAILDLNTGNAAAKKGFLPPQVALTATNSASPVNSPATGLIVYNTSTAGFAPNNVVPGYYYWNGSAWLLFIAPGPGKLGQSLVSQGGGAPIWSSFPTFNVDSAWGLKGNAGTSRYTNFVGNTDNNDLVFRIDYQYSGIIDNTTIGGLTYFGYGAGATNIFTSGSYNTGFGYEALTTAFYFFFGTPPTANTALGYESMYNLSSGSYNTGSGWRSMYTNGSGSYNNANGAGALYSNNAADYNCANGYESLFKNNTGAKNSANGYEALYNNSTASNNTANGSGALYTNTTGTGNCASGYEALYLNKSGINNTANGYEALYSNTTGGNNTANGYQALYSNTAGINNTASGNNALYSNTVGSANSAEGSYSLYYNNATGNTALGDSAGFFNTAGTFNTYIGYQAGNNSALNSITNTTCLGYGSGNSASNITSNSIYLGNASLANIYSEVQSISAYSDRRIKDNIKENVPGLSFITKLRPVTFHYSLHKQDQILGNSHDFKGKYDIEKITQSGFIAQEVDSIAKLCGYDFNGIIKPQTTGGLYQLGYTDFVVPLVKAVEEQKQKMDSIREANLNLKTALYQQTCAHTQDKQALDSRLKEQEQEITELKKMVNTLTQVQASKQ